MSMTRFLAVSLFLLLGIPALAHDKGPCASYFEGCKSDAGVTGATSKKAKWEAMNACVTAAAKADTANGQACLDAQAKHHHHHHHAAAPAPAPTSGN